MNLDSCIILHPTDFSSHASGALKFALNQLHLPYASLFIIHVADMPTIFNNPKSDDPELWARDLIQTSVAEIDKYVNQHCMSEHVPFYEKEIILHTSIYKGILESIERIKPYMVVIGQHGQSALKEMIIGSTAKHLFGKVNCPLVIVP